MSSHIELFVCLFVCGLARGDCGAILAWLVCAFTRNPSNTTAHLARVKRTPLGPGVVSSHTSHGPASFTRALHFLPLRDRYTTVTRGAPWCPIGPVRPVRPVRPVVPRGASWCPVVPGPVGPSGSVLPARTPRRSTREHKLREPRDFCASAAPHDERQPLQQSRRAGAWRDAHAFGRRGLRAVRRARRRARRSAPRGVAPSRCLRHEL